MKKQDFFKMAVGTYELTDSIKNYYYTLVISLCDDGKRMYQIREKGSISRERITMFETYVNEYGNSYSSEGKLKYKTLSALSIVGGLTIRTHDTYGTLSELRFIARGSFSIFAEKTSEFEKNLFLCPTCRERITCGDAMSEWCENCSTKKHQSIL